MGRHRNKPSVKVTRLYFISGEADEVERVARYVKGRGRGRIVKASSWRNWGRKPGEDVFRGGAVVSLRASPRCTARR